MSYYGELPKQIGTCEIECKEMMFYQYLPIKLIGEHLVSYEPRLRCFDQLVGVICCDYIGTFGLDRYVDSYVYLTAKYMYQKEGCSYNRPGWHSDGFMTDDINYIWYDKDPTTFNCTEFNLSQDDMLSLKEMKEQWEIRNNKTYPNNTILRLDQYNIHRVGPISTGMRAFIKVSFSKDKYDLIGNAHNYLLDYNWEMKPRKEQRNIPQSAIDSNTLK
jgi:hypothetical protein